MQVQIDPSLFEPIRGRTDVADEIVRPSITYWQDAWRRFKKNKPAMIGLVTVIIIILSAIFVPMFWPYDYATQIRGHENQGPSWEHPFGTDSLGRDLFIRVMYGARISLSIGLVASLINLTIGVLYGGISGYVGGRVDNIMMRIVDILYSVPLLLYVILLQVVLEKPIEQAFETSFLRVFKGIGSDLILIYIVLGLVYWVNMARIVRGQVLSLKNQEFVLAAKAQGASAWRIIWKHLIPNAIGPIIVTVTLAIPSAIFTEAFLSFIGIGVSAPMASWGTLASDAYRGIRSYPYLLFFPAACICITMIAFNLLGDGLRDALDPHMRK
ncbi:ABC transporter permease [Caldicoprobacter faecalis]|uniref:Oligopeptide transport system permease protein n=1 Tax=Caldicoprobacter faecalis TaxID=937334 RepID=A0A1I5SQ55_9FIRM|nr:ABC transporter permease [Caldicoprobacter faecalis]SFP72751.1 oligopeptide transport system permease protein [Caldicoprobacter faecalis]